MASMEEDLRKNKSEASADELPYVHTFQADAKLKAEVQGYEEANPPSHMGMMGMSDEDYERRGEIRTKFNRICGAYHRGSATVRRGDVIIPKE